MTDIVERLHAHADALDWTGAETAARDREAAAEIERLRAARDAAMRVHVDDGAEIERLTDELQDCQSRTITMGGELRAEIERLTHALEDIALLDECDGHELAVRHAYKAVAIATSTLGKHPSVIAAGGRLTDELQDCQSRTITMGGELRAEIDHMDHVAQIREAEIERLRAEDARIREAARLRILWLQAEIERLQDGNEFAARVLAKVECVLTKVEVEIERLQEALRRIDEWSCTYPLAISADAMRHVMENVGKIARAALGEQKQT